MQKQMNQQEKLIYMTETPLPRLIITLAIPTIISMLITALYNLADTFFVGLIGDASATGAIGVVFPLMSIMQAVAFMFGHGSGNHMSRALGAGRIDDAKKMAATGFFSAIMAGAVLMVIGLCFSGPIAKLLGATPTIEPFAREYILLLMPGVPFLIGSFVINNQLRFQGSAFYGMIGMTCGTILNVILDPIFIFSLNMGVTGAALATSIGQFTSFCVLLLMSRQGSNIRISLKNFSPTAAVFKEIFRGGVPSLARQGLASLASICLNLAAAPFLDEAIAAMSNVNRVMQMCNSAIIGFGQGFQPVCGFNYGAKKYSRVRKAFWFSVKVCAAVLIVTALVVFPLAPQIMQLLIKDSPKVWEIGQLALRMQCVVLPLASFVIMANMMLQTIGLAGRATLLATARQGLFLIPSVFILPGLLGLLGLQMAQPVSDLFSFLLAVPITVIAMKNFPKDE